MKINKEKLIQEAGTPALLCFKSEELPTDCHITSLINNLSNKLEYLKFMVLRRMEEVA